MELVPKNPTAKGPSTTFTGDVYVTQVFAGQEPSRMGMGLVRFTPGARSNWHSHAVGQTLHCAEGAGLVVNRDGTVIHLRPGDTVVTPPGEEHWHGAVEDMFMSHFALLENAGDGTDPTTWLEPVTDEQYLDAQRS